MLYLNQAKQDRFATIAPMRVLPDGTRVPAHGAQITLTAGADQGPLSTDIVPGGEGHSGKSAPEVSFGLGLYPADERLSAEIRWREAGTVHSQSYPVRPGRQVVDLVIDQASATDQ